VVTALQIDESGAVKNVQILRSSGSNEIDLPIQRAMFEWWIEPAKDADGNPVPDVAIFTITLR
jgi:TonB family protein